QSLSPSEALCTYLHRQRGLSFHEIALLINRDERSVWTSCSRAGAKRGTLIQPDKDSIRIPTSLFHDRSLSILEHVVYHLKSAHSMTNAKVAALLNKNPSAVATVAKRAERKRADIKMQEKAGAKNPPERKGGAGR
ncbi:hypothetical protein KY362_02480, partial [Candidatus Woesearchaeota archaeon]|nr:hypothetical protein [Candidatus Woesearchaeota archaeon]